MYVQASFLALLSWYRTCSLTTERVLLLQNVFAHDRMCSLTIKKNVCAGLFPGAAPHVFQLFFLQNVFCSSWAARSKRSRRRKGATASCARV